MENSKDYRGLSKVAAQEKRKLTFARTIDCFGNERINATLFITTTVAPLKNELLYQKEKIIERVNEALGEKTIKEVVIK